MRVSLFSPPKPFDDNIVGEVVLRTGARRFGQVVAAHYIYKCMTDNDTSGSRQMVIAAHVHSESTDANNSRSKPSPNFPMARIDQSSVNTQRKNASSPIGERQQQLIDKILQTSPDLLDDLSRSYAREREERRQTQQRYRNKFRLSAMALEHDVIRLRRQIEQHELERNFLLSNPPTTPTPWNVVSEYYRLFRNGFKGCQPSISTSKPTSEQGDIQLKFVHQVMAPDVIVNNGMGVDTLIQQWLAIHHVHHEVTVRLLRLECDEENAILASIKSYIIITEEMLRREFPYFGDLSKDSETSRLATKLIGQQLVIPATVRFTWDCVSRRIISVLHSSDLVTPFFKLLGNLQDTARVLDNALLSIVTSL